MPSPFLERERVTVCIRMSVSAVAHWERKYKKLERALGRAHTFATATLLVLGMRVWGP